MKHPVLTIFKKELARFFGDKRMVISILMPGILIYVLYSFMGNALMNQFGEEENPSYTIDVVNLPDSVQTLSEGSPLVWNETDSMDASLESITNQDGFSDVLAVFPEDFDAAVAAGTGVPQISIYYNSVSTASQGGYQTVLMLLDAYESSLSNVFDINAGSEQHDLAKEEDITASIFSMMLPMLLMMFLFSGSMGVAPESIAGEKERGTIATLLVTPAPRSSIALGKILALSIISLLSGTSSAIGTILALPKLMGGSAEISGNAYAISDYFALAAVILSTVLVLVTMISILSAFAKSIKEAQTFVTPLMIVVMLLGVTAMFGNVAEDLFWYCIPLYNSVQCMSGIFSFQLSVTGLWLTVAVNLTVALLGVFVLTRMFHSEKVIFSK